MFILASKDQELVSLIECGCVAQPYTWNVPVVVDKAPLVADKIKLQDMIVDLVSVLVEPTKGKDLVVAAVCDGCIDEARRTLSEGAYDSRPVYVANGAVLYW